MHAERIVASGFPRPTCYHPDQLKAMIATEQLDRVIITSPDYTHADLIVRALDAGANVIVEKTLTNDADGCTAIAEATARTGRSVVMTFNYRYSPRNCALKQVVASGAIGQVTSAHFEWVLDTSHGTDYFRRWHRNKENSGGLLIHKASHHFDLVNWWIANIPVRVFASGGLRFYGHENAQVRGLGDRPQRGSVDGWAANPFLLDLRSDPELNELYYLNEHLDGYLSDQDVFGEGITIEDSLWLVVDYARGASMCTHSTRTHRGRATTCRSMAPTGASSSRSSSGARFPISQRLTRAQAQRSLLALPARTKWSPGSVNGSSSSDISRTLRSLRLSPMIADMPAATKACCMTCSTGHTRTRLVDQPPGATVFAPLPLASLATSHW